LDTIQFGGERLTRHGRRLEVTINDIHEIVIISY